MHFFVFSRRQSYAPKKVVGVYGSETNAGVSFSSLSLGRAKERYNRFTTKWKKSQDLCALLLPISQRRKYYFRPHESRRPAAVAARAWPTLGMPGCIRRVGGGGGDLPNPMGQTARKEREKDTDILSEKIPMLSGGPFLFLFPIFAVLHRDFFLLSCRW